VLKILGISGSPRRGSTEYAVQEALRAAAELPGITTEFLTLRGKEIKPCHHCNFCLRNKALCPIKDDMVTLYDLIMDADAYIIGSPVYTMSISGQLQSFLNRWRPLHHVRKGILRNRPAGAIAVGGARHGGQELALSTLIHYFLARGMVPVGAEIGHYSGGSIWSKDKLDGAARDTVGLETVRSLGRRVGELALLLKEGAVALQAKGIVIRPYETRTHDQEGHEG